MSNAGAVLYAKDMRRLAGFYSVVAGLTEVLRDRDEFVVLQGRGIELVVVAVPERIASTLAITDPPRRREATPIKLFFEVPGIDVLRPVIAEHGGALDPRGREWQFRDWRVCDGHDPEGNVFQVRERLA
jgi:predicted enzyme related to lactoylglutathione lyase